MDVNEIPELIAIIRKLVGALIGGNRELSAEIENMTDEQVIALARADKLDAQLINERLKAKIALEGRNQR